MLYVSVMRTPFIYRSRSTVPLTVLQVQCLALACDRSNKRNDISGIIFYDGAYFLQVLEGERDAMEALIARIKLDVHHENFVTLSRSRLLFAGFHHQVYGG